MSVDGTTIYTKYDMDGETLAFDFTFKGIKGSEEDIKCATISSGTVTLLTYETDYSVVITDDGGTVTVEDAQDEDIELLVWRDTTNTQESSYDDYNHFPADTVESDFDKRTLVAQETADAISRALVADISTTLGTLVADTGATVSHKIPITLDGSVYYVMLSS